MSEVFSKHGVKVKEVIPMSSIRRVIAERMTTSLREMAQVTLMREEVVEALVKVREELKDKIEKEVGVRLTYTPIFIKVAAEALKNHPIVNSVLEDDQIKILDEINIGFAVATERGLIVPVVKNVDKKDFKTIVYEVNSLITKTREGRLTFQDIEGGTFTITNLGMYGIDGFTPIINPPQVAILGIGRIINKPVVVENRIEIKPTCVFSLTHDHRVIDGHVGAQFLDTFIKILTNEQELKRILS
jgi:pyruvate dehydrogenase E2 component (dihydrolipoamide acetyltransferase)